jgi:hypothetical protein
MLLGSSRLTLTIGIDPLQWLHKKPQAVIEKRN